LSEAARIADGDTGGYRALLARVRANLNRVIEGKPEVVDLTLITLAAGGSILMEDVPGVGKTTLAKALARSLDAIFARIQFTPDLLPADILGCSIYSPVDGTFSFRPGPVFCNVLLADEINRASPRTQSALLEAMSEAQATIEGTLRPLPSPFFVVATQNPVEYHGTYPLPEAQLDRFMVLFNLGYPAREVEVDILFNQATKHPLGGLQAVITTDDVLEIQRRVRKVHVARAVAEYLVGLITQTRSDPRVKLGVSPRGSLMLFRAAQAAAFLDGRDHVLPDDVQRMAPYVLSHRIVLTSKAKYGGLSKDGIVDEIIGMVPVPT
jgi:MoxR-like ATPase